MLPGLLEGRLLTSILLVIPVFAIWWRGRKNDYLVSDDFAPRTAFRTASKNLPQITFHIIPHSHCDAAYKKTFDEYYETQVRNVLDSMLKALQKCPLRRFVWSETIYLDRWWKDPRTSKVQKNRFQALLVSGQIEIVNGGWVMHDESITRYDSQIHQMTIGHDHLQQMFLDPLRRPNVSISTGWQIDPFGPSPFTVHLNNWTGMYILILNRMPDHVKDSLKANQTLEFYWKTDENAKILVHVLDTHYSSPEGFDWEDVESGPPVPITKENVQERSDVFMMILMQRSTYYRTPNVMIPMGGDFTFQNATMQFQNMERILNFVQNHPGRYGNVTFRYSTPKEYKDAMLEHIFRTKSQGLPVITNKAAFQPLWTGYYFQLPQLKQMLRSCEVILRSVEVQLVRVFVKDLPTWDSTARWIERIRHVRRTIGLMQHHDAITATSYRFVILDYMQRLRSVFRIMENLIANLLLRGGEKRVIGQEHNQLNGAKIIGGGDYLHETILVRDAQTAQTVYHDKILSPLMGHDGIPLVVVNSLGHQVITFVHFVCSRDDVAISKILSNSSSIPVLSQATPLDHELEVSSLGLFLISFAATVPPFGSLEFNLQVCDLTWNTFQDPAPEIPSLLCAHKASHMDQQQLLQEGLHSNSTQISFNHKTLELDAITTTDEGGSKLSAGLNHDFILYYGGNDTIYEFGTNVESSNPPPLFGSRPRRLLAGFSGPIFSQVTLEYTNWLSIRYRLSNVPLAREHALQATVFAGPLPSAVNLASRFRVEMHKTSWWIDENGFLPTSVSYNAAHGVGDLNTRPLVSRSWIKDQQTNRRFSVYTVDPRAIVSKRDGEMDVFWHRRNKAPLDWWKQGDDLSSIASSIWINFGRDDDEEELCSRRLAAQLANDLVLFTGPVGMGSSADEPTDSTKRLNIPLPPSLHLVSLRLTRSDPEMSHDREDAWVDLQLENLSMESIEVFDLTALFRETSRFVLQAITLYTLTFLEPQQDNSNGCSLQISDGGKHIFVVLEARRICSVRMPVSQLYTNGPMDD